MEEGYTRGSVPKTLDSVADMLKLGFKNFGSERTEVYVNFRPIRRSSGVDWFEQAASTLISELRCVMRDVRLCVTVLLDSTSVYLKRQT